MHIIKYLIEIKVHVTLAYKNHTKGHLKCLKTASW